MTVDELIEKLQDLSSQGFGESELIVTGDDCESYGLPSSVSFVDDAIKKDNAGLVCIDTESGGFLSDIVY